MNKSSLNNFFFPVSMILKPVLILLLAVCLYSNAYTLSEHREFSIGGGFILDALPLPEAGKKIMVLNLKWHRNIWITKPTGFFSGGYNLGILMFYALPIPHVSFLMQIFPPNGFQFGIETGIFYDMIYGGLFGVDIRIVFEIRKKIKFEILILPTPIDPYNKYPEEAAGIFKPPVRLDPDKGDSFPDALYGIMLSYKFKTKTRRKHEK